MSRRELAKAVKAYRDSHPGASMKEARDAAAALIDGVPDVGAAVQGAGWSNRTSKLGFGCGTMIKQPDGTASYSKSGTLTDAFRVRIADVAGFSVLKGEKAFERELHILGHGAELANCSVNHGAAEKVEGWFRAHREVGSSAPGRGATSTAPAMAEELTNSPHCARRGCLPTRSLLQPRPGFSANASPRRCGSVKPDRRLEYY